MWPLDSPGPEEEVPGTVIPQGRDLALGVGAGDLVGPRPPPCPASPPRCSLSEVAWGNCQSRDCQAPSWSCPQPRASMLSAEGEDKTEPASGGYCKD